jgi:SAM-dependent methyltransferase
MMASVLAHGVSGRTLYRERNFFGAVQVTLTSDGRFHQLVHGSTIHGRQNLDPRLRLEPLTYYYRNGPIGQVLKAFCERPARPNVAIVGLGAGSLASYAEPGQAWTMYEIDPAIERIARDPRYFTFLRDSRAGSLDVVLGDARLQLRDAPDHAYGLIVLDAFSSDAIPMHLLTREALQLYREKLAEGGILAFHISNRYVDLAPVLGALAREAHLVCRVRTDLTLRPEDQKAGKDCSAAVVMAARDEDLGAVARDPAWQVPQLRNHESIWSDDFSNIIEHFILKLR